MSQKKNTKKETINKFLITSNSSRNFPFHKLKVSQTIKAAMSQETETVAKMVA